MKRHNSFVLIVQLALADLWFDRKVSFCVIASLVAVIAPLLLLFGLKHGVITQLQNELLSDPRNLEIKLLTSGNFDQVWLDSLRARKDVSFAVGLTRSLNTQADLIGDNRRFVENAEVVPTEAGDPLLSAKGRDLQYLEVILSHSAAEQLEAVNGARLRIRAQRQLDGVKESGELVVTVVSILTPAQFSRPAIFVNPQLLQSLEHLRDGYHSPQWGLVSGKGPAPINQLYARARVYAVNIDAVAPLAHWFDEQHIETASRLADIENVKAINHVLGLIFGVIAGAALIGCVASLIGAFLANIDRKRRSLALLRLLGLTKLAVAFYVMLQAIIMSIAGFAGGLTLYSGGAELFDSMLGASRTTGGFVCEITWEHGVIAFVLSLFVAAIVALIGTRSAIEIEPAESLREL